MIDKLIKSLNATHFLKGSTTAPVIFLEIIAGLSFSLASILIFAKIGTEVLEKETHSFDVGLSQTIYTIRDPLLTQIMIWISFLGADFIIFCGALIAIFLAWKKHKREAILFTALLILGLVLNVILKYLYARPRPEIAPLLDLSATYSFPSGHAMNSFIFYSILAYFVYHFTKNKKLGIIVACCSAVVILLIGFSRIYLGVHYPTDVLAGYFAGFCVFITAIVVDKTFTFLSLRRRS